MGIPGLYEAIGKPGRVSLCKLAVDHFARTGRKFRVAIDASIWLFQVKASLGGANPELRTLYYRLLRLLRLGVDPVLVFDGPGRPSEKRNKKVAGFWESPRAAQARSMLDHFRFVYHHAPGEAEAECALLQRKGVVDAVFSEDVDTLMFGATLTIRNWSSQEKRTKTPSHVDVHRADDIKKNSGIDREGMILIALMSGGDYDTVGIKGCGPVIARETAKAGFGLDLCHILQAGGDLTEWRERLIHELRQNESGFYRRKSPKTANGITSSFPSQVIADSYLHPLVSSYEELQELSFRLDEHRSVDILGLRSFLGDRLEWSTLGGALKYIRGMAPALLTEILLDKSRSAKDIGGLITVCGARNHFSSDGILEHKVKFTPAEIVPVDLSLEPRTKPSADLGEAIDIDSEEDGCGATEQVLADSEEASEPPPSPSKRRPSRYDPSEPDKVFVPEIFVRLRASTKISNWEELSSRPKVSSPRKRRTKAALAGVSHDQRTIDSYFGKSKPSGQHSEPREMLSQSAQSERMQMSFDSNFDRDSGRHLHSDPVDTLQTAGITKTTTIPSDCMTSPSFSQSTDDLLNQEARDITPVKSQSTKKPSLPLSSVSFRSLLSSQEMIDIEVLSTQSATKRSDVSKSQVGVRFRESLPGSWDTNSCNGDLKSSRSQRNIEVVDMT